MSLLNENRLDENLQIEKFNLQSNPIILYSLIFDNFYKRKTIICILSNTREKNQFFFLDIIRSHKT